MRVLRMVTQPRASSLLPARTTHARCAPSPITSVSTMCSWVPGGSWVTLRDVSSDLRLTLTPWRCVTSYVGPMILRMTGAPLGGVEFVSQPRILPPNSATTQARATPSTSQDARMRTWVPGESCPMASDAGSCESCTVAAAEISMSGSMANLRAVHALSWRGKRPPSSESNVEPNEWTTGSSGLLGRPYWPSLLGGSRSGLLGW